MSSFFDLLNKFNWQGDLPGRILISGNIEIGQEYTRSYSFVANPFWLEIVTTGPCYFFQ